LGHANWGHFFGNATFLLLLGPILEEKFGSVKLLAMIMITAFTDVIISQYFLHSCGIGASGIVFMFIVLSSISHTKESSIPLTFILVAVLFLGKEVIDSFKSDNVSQAGHLIGGACGAAFGFILKRRS
jgi:membrane associated rhomboid family serine protease